MSRPVIIVVLLAAALAAGCGNQTGDGASLPPDRGSSASASGGQQVRVLAPIPDADAPQMDGAVANGEQRTRGALAGVPGMQISDEAAPPAAPLDPTLTTPEPISVAKLASLTPGGRMLDPPQVSDQSVPTAVAARQVPLLIAAKPVKAKGAKKRAKKVAPTEAGSAALFIYRSSTEAAEAHRVLVQLGAWPGSVLRAGNVVVVLDDAFAANKAPRSAAVGPLLKQLNAAS